MLYVDHQEMFLGPFIDSVFFIVDAFHVNKDTFLLISSLEGGSC